MKNDELTNDLHFDLSYFNLSLLMLYPDDKLQEIAKNTEVLKNAVKLYCKRKKIKWLI